MNKLFLFFVIIITTVIVFVAGVGISNCSERSKQFRNYSRNSENEDIFLNVQVMKSLETTEETKTDYEKADYDVYFIITKKNSLDSISNLYVYLCSETDNEYKYMQSSSARSISPGSTYIYYRNTTMNFCNSASAFAYQEVQKTDDKVKFVDKTPDNLYVRVTYTISYEKDGNTELHNNELKYKFSYDELNTKRFSSYEKRNVIDSAVDSKDDPFELKFIYQDDYQAHGEDSASRLTFSSFDVLEEKLPENRSISSMELDVYGKLDGIGSPSSEYFDEYQHLFKYIGSFNVEKPRETIDASRYSYIPKSNNLSDIYITCTLKLDNGKKMTYKYSVDVSKLPQA